MPPIWAIIRKMSILTKQGGEKERKENQKSIFSILSYYFVSFLSYLVFAQSDMFQKEKKIRQDLQLRNLAIVQMSNNETIPILWYFSSSHGKIKNKKQN